MHLLAFESQWPLLLELWQHIDLLELDVITRWTGLETCTYFVDGLAFMAE